jgi:hypothetical protein
MHGKTKQPVFHITILCFTNPNARKNITPPPAKPAFQHHPKHNNKMESGIPHATSILLLLLPFFCPLL